MGGPNFGALLDYIQYLKIYVSRSLFQETADYTSTLYKSTFLFSRSEGDVVWKINGVID